MKTITPRLCVVALLMLSTPGWAQQASDQDATQAIAERHLSEGLDVESMELEERVESEHRITFEQGLELLAQNSLDVESARQALVEASILDNEARANFAPTVNVSGRVAINDPVVRMSSANPLAPLVPYLEDQYQNTNDANVQSALEAARFEPDEVIVNPRFDYRASLTVTQPLYNGNFFGARKIADLSVEQANASIAEVTFYVQEAYTQLYFQAVSLQRLIEVSRSNVDVARVSLEREQGRFRVGAGSEMDLTRAEVTYLTALNDYEVSVISYNLSVEALATLMRMDPDFEVQEPQEMTPPQSVEQVLHTAFEERPELVAADLNIEQTEIQKSQARSRFHPYVYAQGQANAQRVTAFTGRAVTWNVSLNLSWDLWDGGETKRTRQRLDVAKRQAELQRARLEDEIRTQIRQAWLTMKTQKSILERARATAKLAQISYDVAVRSQELGASSALEVDNAQIALYAAQVTEANAEVKYRAAIYELYRLQGNGQDLAQSGY